MLTEPQKIKILELLDEIESTFQVHPHATMMQDFVYVAIPDIDLYFSPPYGAFCQEVHQREELQGIRITFCSQTLSDKQRQKCVDEGIHLEVAK